MKVAIAIAAAVIEKERYGMLTCRTAYHRPGEYVGDDLVREEETDAATFQGPRCPPDPERGG
jgi:hypothetical protein